MFSHVVFYLRYFNKFIVFFFEESVNFYLVSFRYNRIHIYWAAGVAGGAIVGFIAAYCLMGFVAGLVVLATVLSAGIVLIILKQRKGLHSKNVKRGVYVYAYSHKV